MWSARDVILTISVIIEGSFEDPPQIRSFVSLYNSHLHNKTLIECNGIRDSVLLYDWNLSIVHLEHGEKPESNQSNTHFNRLKHLVMRVMSMQVLGLDSIFILLNALFIQIAWMSIARRARDRYLRDLAGMRNPTSRLSRYYRWRVSSVANSIIDGIIFLSILTTALMLMVDISQIMSFIALILFVVLLSGITTVQSVYKIRQSNAREVLLITKMEQSSDKVSTARETVIPLLSAGPLADGRMWFTLYRVAQRQDPIGWALRDVLQDEEFKEKHRNVDFTAESSPDTEESESDVGPRIN